MLQFLNPIGLFGISAILIPLIIHLWNVKTGKTLKVGSISLMGESSRQNSRSLKLIDLLLLLLRCLVIIAASLIWADPVWKTNTANAPKSVWVLADRNELTETYDTYKPQIDSLLEQGAKFHLFEPGFPEIPLQKALSDSSTNNSSDRLSYWALVKLLDENTPAGTQAFLYTPNTISNFSGTRPAISTRIKWYSYTRADSTSQWIANAYLTSLGDVSSVVTTSTSFGNSVKTYTGENSDVNTSITNGKLQISLPANPQVVVNADTATIRIGLYTDSYSNDLRYVSSALDAIWKYTNRKIIIERVSRDGLSNHDVVFWLSSAEAAIQTMKPGSVLFRYAPGNGSNTNTAIHTGRDNSIRMYKRVTYPAKRTGSIIWADGFGEPILERITSKKVSVYTLYTHLNPQWTDLVWDHSFVKLLMPVIIPFTEYTNPWADRRTMSAEQIQPVLATGSNNTSDTNTGLSFYFWLGLVLFFISERLLYYRNHADRT